MVLLRSLPLPLYLVALLSLSEHVTGVDVKITSAQGLIDLSEKVLLGTNYADTTIFLENDIDFTGVSGNFKPIGDSSNDFRGVFDGQGYKISNLKVNSGSFRHAGFFGFSNGGIAVRNLVLDDTCSISSSKVTTGESNTFSGGIIGCCDALSGSCVFENNVNMAAVSFTGSAGWNMFLGGIASQLYHEGTNSIVIRNCINYGDVTFTGASSLYGHIGGILGAFVESDSTAMKYIQNCVNYGTITVSGTTKDSTSFTGGIVGISYYPARVENCVSVGQIALSASSVAAYTGAILGFAKSNGEYLNCHWTNGTGYDRVYGMKEFDSITVTSTGSSKITIDADSVSTLNSYGSWNKCVFNQNSASVTFHTNGGGGYTIASQKLILLPSLVDVEGSGLRFSGWYTDVTCTSKLDANTITTYGSVDLYGGWKYTVSFNGNGGVTSQPNKDVVYGQHYGPLPEITKEGYTLLGWYTASSGGSEVKSSTKVTITSGQTLYAQWTIAKYTVTFDGNGGNPTKTETTVTYDQTYGDLGTAMRTGYTFAGWYTAPSGGTKVESNTTVTITEDHTIYAQWMINNYTVTFKIDNETITAEYQFNDIIEYPENVTEKEGFMFGGWDKAIERMPAKNITINAVWYETSEFVEIVFGTKDLTEDDVTKIIGQYAGDNAAFIIVEFKDESADEIRVIIKFNDASDGEAFVRTVKEVLRDGSGLITDAKFVKDVNFSGANTLRPVALISILTYLLRH